MKVKVLNKEESKFFPRVEGIFEVEYAGATPSRKELASEISKAVGHDEKLIIIRRVKSKYGEQICSVEASLYLDEKSMKNIEKEFLLKKNNKIEEKKENKESNKTEEKGE